jgi:RNA polymerase sigma-70 factor (ECF subfamily)
MQSDIELIALSRKGNMLAFRQLVERHEAQVKSTVVGMLGDTPEAEDVGQEVFIRFFKALGNFRDEAALSTYLTRIAINLSLNELKKRKRKLSWLGGLKKDSPAFEMADASEDPERADLKDLLRKALKTLDADFRAVVVLRLIDGYSVRETAEILNLPEGTVASRLARAQKKLKTILSKWM